MGEGGRDKLSMNGRKMRYVADGASCQPQPTIDRLRRKLTQSKVKSSPARACTLCGDSPCPSSSQSYTRARASHRTGTRIHQAGCAFSAIWKLVRVVAH